MKLNQKKCLGKLVEVMHIIIYYALIIVPFVTNKMSLLALCLLAGCGVPQEEHDAMILQLQSEKTEIETTLNEKIAELESIVKAEKAKVKSH